VSNSHLLSALVLVLLSAPSLAGPHTLATPDSTAAVRLGDGWLSTGANDFNLSTDAAERWLVFGRSQARRAVDLSGHHGHPSSRGRGSGLARSGRGQASQCRDSVNKI
jgi:hypothetical protein